MASNEVNSYPTVFVPILAKQKAAILKPWLNTLLNWDYPKDKIIIYIRSNNSTDQTKEILMAWELENRDKYMQIYSDYSDVDVNIQQYDVHEWNSDRFKVLGEIRQKSINMAIELGCDFYFISDIDNFLLPHTLSTLISRNVEIIGPMLNYMEGGDPKNAYYSNYHNKATENGYYQENPEYYSILNRSVKGVIEVDVIHCTYLIKNKILPQIKYLDGSSRHEYVIFSDNLRKLGIPQYLDNSQIFGTITLEERI
jgi:hypothetical protein